MAKELTAKSFIQELEKLSSPTELKKYERYFSMKDDPFMGVRMGSIFSLAKEYTEMPISELDKMLSHKMHEVRVGALSAMGKKADNKQTTSEEMKALYDLYIKRIDRVNTWDLVDLSAFKIVGRYLLDKPREILYTFAKSKAWYERRIAIISTFAFIKEKETDDAFKISEILVHDEVDLVNKAVGWVLRELSKIEQKKFYAFMDKYAATMPRVQLRYALEKTQKKLKDKYMVMKP